jgi:hypothetical protein
VSTNPATRDDFLSNLEKGQPPVDDSPEMLELARGVSVNATLRQAQNRARTTRTLKRYLFVAELAIPDDAPIRFKRTFSSPGHHTLWGDADMLLSFVVCVHPIDGVD